MITKIKAVDKTVFLVFILALLIRILYNIFYVGINDVPTSDAAEYHEIALNLLYSGTYNSITRPPLFPIFIATLYKLFGINPLVVRVALSIFSSFTCLIVYKIAKEVYDRRSALFAMLISATYCMMFCWCSLLLSETLFTFFLMLGVLYLVKSRNHPNLRYLVFGGMYLGLATLTRAYLFPFFLLVPFWAFVTFKNYLKLTSKACCIVVCTMFLVISPVTVRNCVVTHKFIPIIGQSGATFLGANNPEVLKHQKGGWIEPYKSGLFKEEEIVNYKQLSSTERESLCWKKGISFVFKNPLFMLKILFYKFILFWHFNRLTLFSLQYFFVFSFAIYGSIVSVKKSKAGSILYLLILFFTIMTGIFWGDDRFRSPIEPILVIFAACGIAQIFEKIKSQGSMNKEPFLEPILRKLRIRKIIRYIPKDCNLCDFGCGTNAFFLSTVKSSIQLGIGLDLQLQSQLDRKIKLITCNLDENIPLKSNTVDVVTSLAVLEHLHNSFNSLKETYRILKDGGILILTTPTPTSKKTLEFLAFKLGILSPDTIGEHKHYFDKQELRKMLICAGFEDKKIQIKNFQMGFNTFATAEK